MSLSNRVRCTLSAERRSDLEALAMHCDRSVADEARVLLEWAIVQMTRRLTRLYGPNNPSMAADPYPPGWTQLMLPEDEKQHVALDTMMAELRRRLGESDQEQPQRDQPKP